jgi:hypothetical protein
MDELKPGENQRSRTIRRVGEGIVDKLVEEIRPGIGVDELI